MIPDQEPLLEPSSGAPPALSVSADLPPPAKLIATPTLPPDSPLTYTHTLAHHPVQSRLFDITQDQRRPLARVVLLAGPSGCGKTSLTRRLGLPTVALDSFYRDGTDPKLPHINAGLVDWDDVGSWDHEVALAALLQLCCTGSAQIPIYDIPSNACTGESPLDLDGHRLFIAEGIFAASLVESARREGILADAICIARSPLKNAWFRLLRDLGEARKPVRVLLVRGFRLARQEPTKVRQWLSLGCRPVKSWEEAEATIRHLPGFK